MLPREYKKSNISLPLLSKLFLHQDPDTHTKIKEGRKHLPTSIWFTVFLQLKLTARSERHTIPKSKPEKQTYLNVA